MLIESQLLTQKKRGESEIGLQKPNFPFFQIESLYNITKFPNFQSKEIKYIYKNEKNISNFWIETKRLKIIPKNTKA